MAASGGSKENQFDYSSAIRSSGGIEVPASDESREYASKVLSNGMTVLVVSDPLAVRAAAAVSVRAGSYDEPQQIPGLAHFLEHMCFMGSDKYPDEEGWHKWIAANGGMSNAFTAAEETRYFFEVKATQLEEALDRFAGFFTSPLLKEDGAARELLAVDSEHAKNKQSDMWREMQLDRSTSDPKHVHNRFATGDSKTLRDLPVQEGVDVRKALLEYHQRNYHAGRMYAVVVGTEPTDRLLDMASRLFEAVKKEGEEKTVYPSDPYGPERTGIVQYMLPLQETRRLNLKWALPPAKKHWRSKPLSLLSHLIGHETKGSVANYLREKGWSVGLMCGQLDSAESLSSFGVIIDLSEDGLVHWKECAAAVFAYVRMLLREGPQKWVFDEVAAVNAMQVRYKSKQGASSYAASLAGKLKFYPPEKCVTHDTLLSEWDPDTYTDYLSRLTPESCRIRIQAQEVDNKCTEEERWYGTKYGQRAYSDDEKAAFSTDTEELVAELALPAPNRYIATDFTLRCDEEPGMQRERKELEAASKSGKEAEGADESKEEEGSGSDPASGAGAGAGAGGDKDDAEPNISCDGVARVGRHRMVEPKILFDNDRAFILYHTDGWFGEPRVAVEARLYSANAMATTPREAVLADIFVKLAVHKLEDKTYDAELARLSFSLSSRPGGLAFQLYGFSQKAKQLLDTILSELKTMSFTDDEFERQRKHFEQKCSAYDFALPIRIAMSEASVATQTGPWSSPDKRREAATLEGSAGAELCRDWAKRFFQRTHVRAYVHGNVNKEEAAALGEALAAPFGGMPGDATGDAAAGGAASAGSEQSLPVLAELLRSPILPRCISLPHGAFIRIKHGSFNEGGEDNAAAIVSVCLGPETDEAAAIAKVLSQLMQPEAFGMLRTRESLGYIVHTFDQSLSEVQFLTVAVQSTRLQSVQLERRIEAFLDKFASLLEGKSEEDVAQTREACVSSAVEEQRSLSGEASGIFGEIVTLDLGFDRTARQVRAMRALDKAVLVEHYNKYVRPGATARRAVSVLVEAGKPQENTAEKTLTHQAPPCGPILAPHAVLPFLVAGQAVPEDVVAAPLRAAEAPQPLPEIDAVEDEDKDGEQGDGGAAEAPERTLCSEVGLKSRSMPIVEIEGDRELLRASLPTEPRSAALQLAAFRAKQKTA